MHSVEHLNTYMMPKNYFETQAMVPSWVLLKQKLPAAGTCRTLVYAAPFRTSPLRIQMMEAAGLALSAWQVRFSESPARKLTTGAPIITGSSGGTEKKIKIRGKFILLYHKQWHIAKERKRKMEGWVKKLFVNSTDCSYFFKQHWSACFSLRFR